ncbi:MAG: 3-phosphoglycerate dehydrogenase [Proteobacteria bacterium]|nr:3-phosphoglycerate dehydrogenase [Pseudomonadota bacterium]
MPDIVITEFIEESALAGLKREFDVHCDPTLVDRPDDIVRIGAEAPGLIVRNMTQVRGPVLDGLRRVRVIGRLGVGLDNIDMAACAARGIQVFPATGANAVSVAEYVIAAILVGRRNVWNVSGRVLDGWWDRTTLLFGEASGKRLGLIGFGTIARAVAKRAAALDMTAVATDPNVPAGDPIWRQLGVGRVDLPSLLATSDVVSLHVPLLPATRNLIDGAALARMKPSAGLINTARGGIVDEAALAAALKAGKVGFAVMDVFDKEPLPKGSPLAGAPNVMLTPHIAGNTVESNIRVSRMTADSVRRALQALK